MRKNNIILLLLLLLMAIGWGVVYWIFFADEVEGAVAFHCPDSNGQLLES